MNQKLNENRGCIVYDLDSHYTKVTGHILISRDDTRQLSFQVYRKPTHTEQYLSFSSHHPLQHKLGVIWHRNI